MKKCFLLIALASSLTTLQAQAATFAKFAVYYGIIRVMPTNPAGTHDNDSVNIYQAMNVPVKDSFMGPGKVIQTKDSTLQFICADRQQSGYECSIFIQPGGNSVVNPLEGILTYRLSGDQADLYGKLFHLDAGGNYAFTSVENNFSVTIHPGSFEVSFHQKPDIP